MSEADREGRRRSADDWSYTLDGNDLPLFADRGFTGHEHLPWFNLYNMNGRMYDPLVGRFLNVDPYVQMPDYTQNFNRYSYALNNPLKFTDPDGEWLWIPLMIIGAYIGGTSANDGELNPGKWENDFDTWAGVFLGGSIGALGGYGIMNPGTVELVAGLGNSYVYGGLTIGSATTATGMGTDWDFNLNWTTAAGGGGNYNLNGRNTTPEQIVHTEVEQVRNDYFTTMNDHSSNNTLNRINKHNYNPAREVYYGGMLLSYSLALSDGPQPGPGDAAGIIYGTSTLITAGIVWTGYSIYQMAAEHTSNKSKSNWNKHTDRRSGERYGEERNAGRGDKNKKYTPKKNRNKRPKY